MVTADLKPIPGTMGVSQKYSQDGSPVNPKLPHTHKLGVIYHKQADYRQVTRGPEENPHGLVSLT